MTEDNFPRVSSGESTASIDSSATKQRKKRKWDQPAEALVSASVAAPGILPLGNMVSLAGITLPAAASAPGAMLANPLTASPATIPPQVFQVPLVQPHATAVVQKINQQPKIQDELIAREIVINDADSAIRYKLTKRQTQEEIQKCTGAVVITRGKYRPPNAPPDGEKPLYLHISAGAHLDTTVERIKAVDLAASMVEEMLKQGFFSNGGKVGHLLSTCVYLGFEADPSSNIAARIRGPNDQYVNHIMNETGATVSLRGRGSGNSESAFGEEEEQPLHLFLSSNNPKSLESAKVLAENLLDTISRDCGASRVSSCKVYAAVPPPQQLLAGIPSSGNEAQSNCSPAASLTLSAVNYAAIPPVSSATQHGIATSIIQGPLSQSMGLSSGPSQKNMVCHPQPLLANGTSYSGYGGIYPQATPLQQVALALRQSPSSVNSTVAPATTAAFTEANSSKSSSSEEKRPPQKRKFQELPVAPKGRANPHQNSLLGLEFLKPGEPTSDLGVRNTSTMRTPKKLVQPSTHEMPLPPPRTMPPLPPPKFNSLMPATKVLERTMPLPPPPPKFISSVPATKVVERTMLPPPPPPKFNASVQKSKPEAVSDTLIKLMEYGEEDDDPDEVSGEPYKNNTNGFAAPKPFWAV